MCKLPFSSYRCQVAKKQDAADICKLSVTNALPVYGERSLSKIGSSAVQLDGRIVKRKES